MKRIALFCTLAFLLIASFYIVRKKIHFDESQLPIAHFEPLDKEELRSDFMAMNDQGEGFRVYLGAIGALTCPEIVSINLTDCDDQCFYYKRMPSRYLGQTDEGVHLFLVWGDHYSTFLLFVEVLKGEGVTLDSHVEDKKFVFYEDQVLLKKLGCVALPAHYCSDNEVKFDGKVLSILSDTYELDLSPPSRAEMVRGRVPFHFDRCPFINPIFINDTFPACVRTGGSTVIACDLERAQQAPQYDFLGKEMTNVYGNISHYDYVGKTANDVHIVNSLYFECRPTRGSHLMFVFEKDYEITADWQTKKFTRRKKRFLIKKVGELDLYHLQYFVIDGNVISYTDSFWDNKPYAITGPVEVEHYEEEVKLRLVR